MVRERKVKQVMIPDSKEKEGEYYHSTLNVSMKLLLINMLLHRRNREDLLGVIL